MRQNDEIRMTNSESTTNVQCSSALSSECRALADIGCAKVERVVLNALQKTAALPPNICAFGDHTPIVFRAVTDAQQRPGFPADPPWIA